MKERGFTIIELLIVIIVTGVMTSMVMVFAIGYWRYAYLLDADLDTLVSRLNANDYIRETLGLSSGLIMQNSISDPNTHNPDPNYPSGGYWIPIHAIPGNKPIGTAGTTTPLLYFKRFSMTSSGTLIMNGTQPFADEYILYMDATSKELRARILANPGASGNRVTTTCPPSAATLLCPSDKIIARDIASIDTRYFSRTGNLIDWTSIYDSVAGTYVGPDFTVVEVVELTLNITKKPIFQTTDATQNSTIIRIALRNK